MKGPTDEHYRMAAYVGRRMAQARHLPQEDPNDFAAQAQLIILERWDELRGVCERQGADPDNPPPNLLMRLVDYRMQDWLRLEYGRGEHRRKKHVNAISIDRDVGEGSSTLADFLSDGYNLENEALGAFDESVVALIDSIMLALPHATDRDRVVLELLAEGATLAQIGVALGFTESRACQIVRGLGDRYLAAVSRFVAA